MVIVAKVPRGAHLRTESQILPHLCNYGMHFTPVDSKAPTLRLTVVQTRTQQSLTPAFTPVGFCCAYRPD